MGVVEDRIPVRRRPEVQKRRVVGVVREHTGRNRCRGLSGRLGGIHLRQVDRQPQPQRVGELLPRGHAATVQQVAARKADGPRRRIEVRIRLGQLGEQVVINGLLRVVRRRQHRVAFERLRIRNVAHGVGHDAESVGLQDAAHG